MPINSEKFKFITRNTMAQITCLVFLSSLIVSCGLPDYKTLAKPIVIVDTGSSTVIGFTTPTPDIGTQINGYVLYYKIYTDFTDFTFEDDEKHFDENYYIDITNEFQPGDVVPLSQGYVRAGEFGMTDLPTDYYNIRHLNDGDNILIDFNSNDDIDPNERDEPVAGIGPNPLLDPNHVILARGFIDPRYSNKKLRRFVDDWYYSISTSEFHDGDLRRPPGTQPGTELSDFTGTPILFSDSAHGQFIISFVAYSVGLDTTSGLPTAIYSKPVYIGDVEYTNINRNETRSSELP